VLLCTLALFWITSARAQQIPAAIEMDPPRDRNSPRQWKLPTS
jgi:hypothetical protein